MKHTAKFFLTLMLCIALMLSAFVVWSCYLDVLAFLLGAAGFVAGYFAGHKIETQPNK